MRVLELPRLQAAKLIVDVGTDAWLTYCVLRMVADENDLVTLTPTELGDLMKCAKQTVYNRLRKVQEYMIQGVPLLRLEEHGGAGSWNTYRVMWDVQGALTINGIVVSSEANKLAPSLNSDPVSVSSDSLNSDKLFSPAKRDEDDGVLRTARQVIAFWSDCFKEQYGKDYQIYNWGKEMSFGKKVLTKYGSQRGKAIMATIIKNYAHVWKTPRFPAPTLGMVVSWLGKQAEEYVAAHAEQPAQATDEDKLLEDVLEKGLI